MLNEEEADALDRLNRGCIISNADIKLFVMGMLNRDNKIRKEHEKLNYYRALVVWLIVIVVGCMLLVYSK